MTFRDEVKFARDEDNNLHITGFTSAKEPPNYIFLHFENKKIIVRYEYDIELYKVN
jgi:hypothetical protein